MECIQTYYNLNFEMNWSSRKFIRHVELQTVGAFIGWRRGNATCKTDIVRPYWMNGDPVYSSQDISVRFYPAVFRYVCTCRVSTHEHATRSAQRMSMSFKC